jgi:hypothetical protein
VRALAVFDPARTGCFTAFDGTSPGATVSMWLRSRTVSTKRRSNGGSVRARSAIINQLSASCAAIGRLNTPAKPGYPECVAMLVQVGDHLRKQYDVSG